MKAAWKRGEKDRKKYLRERESLASAYVRTYLTFARLAYIYQRTNGRDRGLCTQRQISGSLEDRVAG